MAHPVLANGFIYHSIDDAVTAHGPEVEIEPCTKGPLDTPTQSDVLAWMKAEIERRNPMWDGAELYVQRILENAQYPAARLASSVADSTAKAEGWVPDSRRNREELIALFGEEALAVGQPLEEEE